MANQKLNIFIVDDNKLTAISIKQFLENRFGANINISIFYDGESCLMKVDQNTNIVILDYFLDGENAKAKNGLEILKAIKKINPRTEVIMFTSNEDVGVTIESFRAGAANYIVKNDIAMGMLESLVYRNITEPIRIMVREFGVLKFLILFLFVFIGMATIVVWVLNLFP